LFRLDCNARHAGLKDTKETTNERTNKGIHWEMGMNEGLWTQFTDNQFSIAKHITRREEIFVLFVFALLVVRWSRCRDTLGECFIQHKQKEAPREKKK